MKISASLLSMRDDLENKINIINDTDIDYIHLDIMDKKFVPNESYNYEEIKIIASNTKKSLDVHLMVENINRYINDYAMYDTEYITIHYEAMTDLSSIDRIKSYGIKCGISIKPNTDVEQIFDLLDKIDLVLIMSVEPGLGGQEFIESSVEKIKKLKTEIKNRNLDIKISVDGGINNNNVFKCIDNGADIVILGSYLLKVSDIKKEIISIKTYN